MMVVVLVILMFLFGCAVDGCFGCAVAVILFFFHCGDGWLFKLCCGGCWLPAEFVLWYW